MSNYENMFLYAKNRCLLDYIVFVSMQKRCLLEYIVFACLSFNHFGNVFERREKGRKKRIWLTEDFIPSDTYLCSSKASQCIQKEISNKYNYIFLFAR